MMKFFALLGLCCLLPRIVPAQSFSVTVINGYGSGTFAPGDTVHIWCKEFDSTRIFKSWTGNTTYLTTPAEWHTSFVMPAQNVSFTANLRTIAPFAIHFEKIMGRDRLKDVFWYFPPAMKGIIYPLHGTGGSAESWVIKTEGRNFINAAVADSFGVIITECEESTLLIDVDGDGAIRWNPTPMDSIGNVDYANMKAITDTFINRGAINYNIPRYSLGMSAGGGFSSTLSYLFNFKSAAVYCAEGLDFVYSSAYVPTIWCLQRADSTIGAAGNAGAFANYQTLAGRGICASYNMHYRFPLYPQYFARIQSISLSLSQSIFTELGTNNLLLPGNYARLSPQILSTISGNPSGFPVILSLSNKQQQEVLNEITSANSEHNFYTDYLNTTLRFFDVGCNSLSAGTQPVNQTGLQLFPNPCRDYVRVIPPGNAAGMLSCYDMAGRLLFTANIAGNASVQTDYLPKGTYLFVLKVGDSDTYRRLVIKE